AVGVYDTLTRDRDVPGPAQPRPGWHRARIVIKVSVASLEVWMTVVYQRRLVRAGETRSFEIRRSQPDGWESFEVQNAFVAWRQSRTDWHRVERDVARFTSQIEHLRTQGWSEG